MTEGRPPKEGASPSGPEREESAPDGRRSQTRKVGEQPPRATFSQAQSTPPRKPAGGAGGAGQASRSAFQYAPSAEPPTSTDPDKTVKRPYPTSPSTWGQTLRLGDPDPNAPEAPGQLFAEEGERTVQVVRSTFVKTLLSGDALSPPTPPSSLGANAPPDARSRSQVQASDSGPPEPLTVPSNRPAPAPWQQSHAAAPTGTILMGSAGTQDKPAPAAPASPAHAARPRVAPASAKQTLPLGSAAALPEVPAPVRAPAPRPPGAAAVRGPAAPPSGAAAAGGPAPAPRGGATSAPAARAATVDGKSVSEPLQLRIADHDVLPQVAMSERPVLPRNRGPLVAALLIAALLVLAGLGWFGLRSTPEVSPEPTRNDAVTVPAAQPPAAPPVAAPIAAPAPQDTAPAQPSAAAAQPAAKAAAPAQPAQPAAAPQQPAPELEPTEQPSAREPEPRTAETPERTSAQKRRAERRAAARAARRDGAPSGPAPEAPESVREARDALRELDAEPIMKIKPAPAEEAAEPEFPSLPEPPEPPPPPE
jgi:hypothetical protein